MVEAIQSEFKMKMINKICLAPMVRLNTLPFRLLTKKYGADYTFSEEIVDKKFLYCERIENQLLNTIDYVNSKDYSLVIRVKKEEKQNFIMQIGSNSAETAVQAVQKLLSDISGIDVNMGCPKKFSVHGGMGSALLRNCENAQSIMSALVKNFGNKISVSCKIRLLNTFEETLQYILTMQETGIDFLSIHPRTVKDETRVPAKWHIIKQVLESGKVKIPILGSGDLFTPTDVQHFLRFTKANGCIIARGAIHNPSIFLDKQLMFKDQNLDLTDSDQEQWKENLIPQIEQVEQQQQSKNQKKQKENDDDSIEFSLNLVKVIERHYSKSVPMRYDILDLIKEYFKLSVETGNNFQNTKYCILYILKTHKQYFELFKKLQVAKGVFEYAKLLDMEQIVQGLNKEMLMHIDCTFYRKNKHIIDDKIVVGEKRKSEEKIIDEIESEQTNKRIKTT